MKILVCLLFANFIGWTLQIHAATNESIGGASNHLNIDSLDAPQPTKNVLHKLANNYPKYGRQLLQLLKEQEEKQQRAGRGGPASTSSKNSSSYSGSDEEDVTEKRYNKALRASYPNAPEGSHYLMNQLIQGLRDRVNERTRGKSLDQLQVNELWLEEMGRIWGHPEEFKKVWRDTIQKPH